MEGPREGAPVPANARPWGGGPGVAPGRGPRDWPPDGGGKTQRRAPRRIPQGKVPGRCRNLCSLVSKASHIRRPPGFAQAALSDITGKVST